MIEILTVDNSDLIEDDFSAYNLEMKTEADQSLSFAWITGNENLYIYTDGEGEEYNPGYGRIAGIEFSSYEPNVLYASCEDEGIVKIDYTSGNYIATLANSDIFGHTYLQTAPDGHIYGVADGGYTLGQTNMQDGAFEANYYSIPNSYKVATYRLFDNTEYYILPENHRTYDPLIVSVETENETCPGYADGTATICVSGGTPGVPPDPEYNIICNGPQGLISTYTYDPLSGCFYITGLSAGNYTFEITDGIGTPHQGGFIIEAYDFDFESIEIASSMSWDQYYPLHSKIEFGILVKSGATLTIDNAYLEFGPQGKIEIEQGARIVSDGTTYRNIDCDPQKKWKGIEVWGTINDNQYTYAGHPCAQGYLELNSSTVMNAENGVAVWALEDNYWWTSGGIVKAINSTFKNNTKSIHFIPYDNTFPPTGQACNNLSYFKNCNFILNYEYIDNTMFYKHVDLHGVSGIDFYACEFSNAASNGVSPWNNGIASYGSKFKVDAGCDQPIVPCPEQNLIPSTFSGFYRAISAHGSGIGTPIYEVWNAEFTNNTIGIYNIMAPGAVMVDNDFYIGLNGTTDGDNCDNVSSFGIDVHAAAGYAIENNYFTKISGGNPGNYVGVRLTETESEADDVYKNEYTGLSVGNLAEGLNRSILLHDHTGVAYLCNENSYNSYDFHVAENSTINGHIGSEDLPSGNTLSQFSQNVELQFRNDYTQDINYYYYVDEPDHLQVLNYYSDFIILHEVATENTCPDHYGGGGTGINVVISSTEKGVKQQVYSQNMADYTLTLDLINTLKDGGDTPLMENEIETAWPDEMWVLRADLLANSPHLSFEVLKDVADRTDVFPESVQFDIFAANPDEMRYGFLTYLESKTPPMSQYMVDMLRQVGYGSSYKTVLKNQLASYYGNAIKAAQDILRSELFDSIPDMNEVRLWLGNIGGYQADKQIIASYLQEGDFTSAQSLLAQLPVTYSLSGDDLLAYNDYNSMLQLQINLMQEDRTIFELDSSELATVTDIAEYGYGSAVYQAQSILEYAHGYHYYDCPALPDSLTLKQHHPGANIFSNDAIHVSVKPNPAHTWAAFDYTLPFSADDGAILIIDITGQVIENISLDQNKGQKVLDTRHIPAGVYIYKIESSGYSSSGKLVIQ